MKSRNFLPSCPAVIALTFGLLCPSSLFAFTEVYNTAGTFNWVCPPGVTSITVECWGSGGAGGSAYRFSSATGANQAGGGGGGGAYARTTAVAVTPGLTYTVTIPAAVTNPVVVDSPTVVNGADVSFSGDATTVTAKGGSGGVSIQTTTNVSTAGAGGAGGNSSLSIGDPGSVFSGGNGAARPPNSGGAGGGGAGDANPGGNADPAGSAGGVGGLAGGGKGGDGRTGSAAGNAGATPGGGGGGAKSQTAGAGLAGGAGGRGQIRLSGGDPTKKADNALALNDPLSWTAGVPTTGDVAVWDSTVTAANTTILGANITWDGIKIVDPGGLVTIDLGNILTLGSANTDIDLSTATADLTVNSPIVMSAPHIWNVQAGRTLTLSGVISGTGAITKQGAGKAVLSATNTFNSGTSGVTITAGTLQYGANNLIPEGSGRGNVVVNGTLDVNGFSDTINGLDGSGIVDTTAVDGLSTLTIGFGVSPSNFTGIIQNTAGTLNLVKAQSGLTQLSNANTFSGTATVTGGTLQLNNALALQNVSAIALTASALSLTVDAMIITAPVSLGTGVTIISPTALANATLSGPLSGTGGLTKTGAGKLTLSGGLTYLGNTLVSSGTLNLGSANSVSDAATVTVAATAALLQLNYAGTDLVGKFFTGTTSRPAGVYGHTDSGAANGGLGVGALNAFFAPGTGTLTVTASAYQNWVTGFAGLTDSTPSTDFDSGSLTTGIEYVLGSDPTLASDDASRAPTSSLSGTDLVFKFRRTSLAASDPNATITVQYGSNLIGWTTAVNGNPGVGITVNTGFFGSDDQVVVTLTDTLAGTGKLFARLNVVIATP